MKKYKNKFNSDDEVLRTLKSIADQMGIICQALSKTGQQIPNSLDYITDKKKHYKKMVNGTNDRIAYYMGIYCDLSMGVITKEQAIEGIDEGEYEYFILNIRHLKNES